MHFTMHYTQQHNRQTCDVDTTGLLSLLPILFVIIHHSVIGSLSNGCVMSQRMFWQSFPCPSCPGVPSTQQLSNSVSTFLFTPSKGDVNAAQLGQDMSFPE